jgi:hypothetical protein
MNEASRPNDRASLRQEVYELACEYVHDGPDWPESARLQTLVCANPEARRYFVEFMCDSLSLHDGAAAANRLGEYRSSDTLQPVRMPTPLPLDQSSAPLPSFQIPQSTFRNLLHASTQVAFHPFTLVSLVGLVAVSILATLFWPDTQPPVAQKPAVPVAKLRRTVDVKWEEGFAPAGDDLKVSQRLKLQAGLAQIVFESQATVILEGPAELQIANRNACKLSGGKLSATVPYEAAGFQVHTPQGTVADLGTEFGVIVKSEASNPPASSFQSQASTEVHVFKGKVEILNALQSEIRNPKSEILSAGSAVRIDAASGLQPITMDADRFRRKVPVELIADLRADYDRASTAHVHGETSEGKIRDTQGSGSWNFYDSPTAAAGVSPHPLGYITRRTHFAVVNPNSYCDQQQHLDFPGVSSTILIGPDIHNGPAGPDELSLHPGFHGNPREHLVARWKAGIDAMVNVVGHIYDQGAVENGVTFEILLNGQTSIWKSQATSGNTPIRFDFGQAVRPGEFLDFVIGPNGNCGSDQSNLKIVITRQ